MPNAVNHAMKLGGDELGTFAGGGYQHVGEHIAVEIHIQKDGVVAHRRANQQQRGDDDFVHNGLGEQGENQQAAAINKQRDGEDKIIACLALEWMQLQGFGVEGVVENGGKIEGEDEVELGLAGLEAGEAQFHGMRRELKRAAF